MIRLVVLLVAALGLAACQTQRNADLPPAPATPKVRPGQQVAVTNAIAKELADEHTKAREPGRGAAVESLKDAGRVAENTRGYLQPLGAATEQVSAIVNQVNDDRRVVYQRLALQQKLDLATVEAIAGDARTSGEQPGRQVIDGSGGAVQR